MRRLFVFGLLAAVIALLAYGLTREPTLPSPLLGRPAPAFAIPLYGADSTLALADLAGQPIVLNFWASWCLACRDEAAVLEAGWQRHGPDVVFVGVAVNDESAAARAFIQRYGKTYLLGADADGSIAIDYGLFGVPETFFIGRDGRVLSKHVGPLTATELERQMASLEDGRIGAATGDTGTVAPLQASPSGGERR